MLKQVLFLLIGLAAISLSVAAACDFAAGYFFPMDYVLNCFSKIPVNPNAEHDLKFAEALASSYVYRDRMIDSDSMKCNSEHYQSADFGIKNDIMRQMNLIRNRFVQNYYTSDPQLYSDLFEAFNKLKDSHMVVISPYNRKFSLVQTFAIKPSMKDGVPIFTMVTKGSSAPYAAINPSGSLVPFDGSRILRINGLTAHEYIDRKARNYCGYSMDHGVCFNSILKSWGLISDFFVIPKGIDVNGVDSAMVLELIKPDGNYTITVANTIVFSGVNTLGNGTNFYNDNVKGAALTQVDSADLKAGAFDFQNHPQTELLTKLQEEINKVLPKDKLFNQLSFAEKLHMIEKEHGIKLWDTPVTKEFVEEIENAGIENPQAIKKVMRTHEMRLKKLRQHKLKSRSLEAATAKALGDAVLSYRIFSDVYTTDGTNKLYARFGFLQVNGQDTEVGYLVLPNFEVLPSESGYQYATGINKMIAMGAKKILIDVRGNGGGYMDSGAAISKFLAPGLPEPSSMWPAVDFIYPNHLSNGFDKLGELSPQETVEICNRTDGFFALVMDKSDIGYRDINNPSVIPEFRATFNASQVKEVNTRTSIYSIPVTFSANIDRTIPYLTSTFTPSDIIILTDGRCGSTCGMFMTFMQYNYQAKVVSVGGSFQKNYISPTKSSIATSSFKGASVLDVSYPSNNVFYIGQKYCIQQGGKLCGTLGDTLWKSQMVAQYTRCELYPMAPNNLFKRTEFDSNCPLEFTKKNSDFHIWTWDTTQTDTNLLHDAAKLFSTCASWEHKPVSYNPAVCGQTFVENAVYGQKCKADGTFDSNSCEIFRCKIGYNLENGVCKKYFTFAGPDPYAAYTPIIPPKSAAFEMKISFALVMVVLALFFSFF